MAQKTAIIAHRGASAEAPENTLAAFEAALKAGSDGVEFDVQASVDGVAMVVHDEKLGRTAHDKNGASPTPGKQSMVAQHTCAQLQKLDAGSWFAPAFADERIPTLEEVLELLQPTTLLINIELKTLRFPYPGLVDEVIRAVETAGVSDQVVLSSFNHHTLLEAKAKAPHLQTAALIEVRMVEPWLYVHQHDFNCLHPLFRNVDKALVTGCAQLGIPVRAWTVNEEAEAKRLIDLAIAGIVTDDPRRMKSLLTA